MAAGSQYGTYQSSGYSPAPPPPPQSGGATWTEPAPQQQAPPPPVQHHTNPNKGAHVRTQVHFSAQRLGGYWYCWVYFYFLSGR